MKNILAGAIMIAVIMFTHSASAQDAELKLYKLECGDIHVSNLNVFSDTDLYVGQEKTLNAGCYLIKHADHWLLWDTGLPAGIAEEEGGHKSGVFHLSLKKTLAEQLKTLDLSPEDITHVGLSHGHFDHTGNVGLFKNATLIMQKADYDLMKNDVNRAKALNMPGEPLGAFLAEENAGKLRLLSGDADIFGDGRVRAIFLPGHTPGHMALLLDLAETGPVILSGDQWHFEENRKNNAVPGFNADRADTLASSDRLNRLVKNTGARLILQHDLEDNEALPALPEFME